MGRHEAFQLLGQDGTEGHHTSDLTCLSTLTVPGEFCCIRGEDTSRLLQPLAFSTSLHFHKIPRKRYCKSNLLPLQRKHGESCTQQTRVATAILKLHQIVGSVQKYPACGTQTGWTASGRVPKTPLAGTCASSWGSLGAKVPGTIEGSLRDSSFSSKAEHKSIK